MKRHLNHQISAIKKTFNKFDFKITDKLVNECLITLNNGGQIITTALGKNEPICHKFTGTLKSLGVSANFLNTNSAVHGDLGVIRKGDLVIILTKSGETQETVYLAKILSKQNTNSWILTCNKTGSVNKYVKKIVVLPVENEGDPWNIVPNNSVAVFLIFLQALTMTLIEKLNIPLSVFKKNHPGGGIGKSLKRIK